MRVPETEAGTWGLLGQLGAASLLPDAVTLLPDALLLGADGEPTRWAKHSRPFKLRRWGQAGFWLVS